jgi:sec-independent protein translocase protein TatA
MDVGIPELIIILVIVMLLFGVGRLPEIGGALGKSIRNFKDEMQGKGDSAGRERKPDEERR